MPESKQHLSLTLDIDVVVAIDERRAYEPRSSYVNRILKGYFG
jgi:hypothetical protein